MQLPVQCGKTAIKEASATAVAELLLILSPVLLLWCCCGALLAVAWP